MRKVYLKSRYDKGGGLPQRSNDQNKDLDFHEALVNAEEAPSNSFEKKSTLKDVCLSKVMAKRGIKKPCFMVP